MFLKLNIRRDKLSINVCNFKIIVFDLPNVAKLMELFSVNHGVKFGVRVAIEKVVTDQKEIAQENIINLVDLFGVFAQPKDFALLAIVLKLLTTHVSVVYPILSKDRSIFRPNPDLFDLFGQFTRLFGKRHSIYVKLDELGRTGMLALYDTSSKPGW